MTQPTDSGDEPTADQGPVQPPVTPQWPSTPDPEAGATPPPPPPAPGAYAPPPAQPVAPAYGPTPQNSSSAVVALVLSIAAWVVCPVIPAIIALVFASKADREIAASNGWVTGGGMVTAAKIVSWINIGLYAALAAIGVLVVVLGVITGSMG